MADQGDSSKKSQDWFQSIRDGALGNFLGNLVTLPVAAILTSLFGAFITVLMNNRGLWFSLLFASLIGILFASIFLVVLKFKGQASPFRSLLFICCLSSAIIPVALFFLQAQSSSSPPLSGESSNKARSLDDLMILVGSGTVHVYLREVFSSLLHPDADPRVLVLEGSTEAGARLLTDAYLHGAHKVEVPFLTMASRKLEWQEFAPQPNDRFFEIPIGSDVLKATLIGATGKVHESFKDIAQFVQTKSRKRTLALRHLQSLVWNCEQKPSRAITPWLFLTTPGSATRDLLEKELRVISGLNRDDPLKKTCWIKDSENWDLHSDRLVTYNKPRRAIALSGLMFESKALNKMKEGDFADELFLLNQDGEFLSRTLFLYGKIDPRLKGTEDRSASSAQTETKLYLESRVAKFLSSLFTSLEAELKNPKDQHVKFMLTVNQSIKDHLRNQREFLHLDDKDGAWIAEQIGGNEKIYRAE